MGCSFKYLGYTRRMKHVNAVRCPKQPHSLHGLGDSDTVESLASILSKATAPLIDFTKKIPAFFNIRNRGDR